MMLRKLSFLLVLLFLPLLGHGQDLNRGEAQALWRSNNSTPLEKVKGGKQLVATWIREDNAYALQLAREVEAYAEKQKEAEVKVIALNALGYAYEWNEDPKSAIQSYKNALQLYQSSYPIQEKIDALCGLGRTYFARGENDIASSYCNQAVKLADASNDPGIIADVYVLIAEFYRATAKYDYALTYLNKVRSIVARGEASPAAEMELYSRLAAVYNEKNYYRDSIPVFSKICIDLGRKYDDQHVVATAMNELGYYYSDTDKQASIAYYQEAIAIWKKLHYLRYEAHCLLNKFRQHNDDFSAQEQINQLLDIIDRIGDRPVISKRLELHEMISSRYESIGDATQALVHYKKYLQLYNAQQILNNQRALDEIQEKYETERNQRTISEQEAELSNQRLEKAEGEARIRQLLWIAAFLLVLLLAVGYAVYRVRLSNRLLKTQKIQIEESKAQLEKLLAGRELLLKEIHHRVKNNLQMVVSLLELQAIGVKDEETKAVLQTGNQRVKSMALVHKRLYQGEELGYVEVDGYLKSLLSEIDSAFVVQGQNVTTELKGNGISLDIDTIIPFGLILTELVTNSFKYAHVNPLEISVSLKEIGEEQYELVYRDNGVGIPEDFDLKKARSLGMRMIKRLTQQLNGSLHFENDKGLRVVIRFEGTAQRQKTA